jgi:transcriptional regulator with XRE-family HTH domain
VKQQKKKGNKRKQVFDQKGIEAFAVQLKKIRMSQNCTQRQLAFESGLALSQIARIKTYRINPTLSTVFIIARTLEIPLSELFNFELPVK